MMNLPLIANNNGSHTMNSNHNDNSGNHNQRCISNRLKFLIVGTLCFVAGMEFSEDSSIVKVIYKNNIVVQRPAAAETSAVLDGASSEQQSEDVDATVAAESTQLADSKGNAPAAADEAEETAPVGNINESSNSVGKAETNSKSPPTDEDDKVVDTEKDEVEMEEGGERIDNNSKSATNLANEPAPDEKKDEKKGQADIITNDANEVESKPNDDASPTKGGTAADKGEEASEAATADVVKEATTTTEQVASDTSNTKHQQQQKQQQQQQRQPVTKIILLGERHSGTNWITDHLIDCFNDKIQVKSEYKRFKHWYQEDDLSMVPENSAVVIAMFRDPYDWVEAMRMEPHHSHDHVNWPGHYDGKHYNINYTLGWRQQGGDMLPWKEFVTQPWLGKRGKHDKQLLKSTPGARITNARCMDRYTWADAAPCSSEDGFPQLTGLGEYKYEFQHDGSERGYSSIVHLRRDKIMNHLSVADFRGTRAFFPFRFEDLNANGTARLLRSVEDATGVKAECKAIVGRADHRNLRHRTRELGTNQITHHKELPDDYIRWMNRYVDWNVEGSIGYTRRGEDDNEATANDDATAALATEKEAKEEQSTKPVEKLILLGERHSGTNWITDYLTECFGDSIPVDNHYKRFKHWFQEEDPNSVPENSAVVVAMFRDPYDWVEAMRMEPHHAPYHVSWHKKHDPDMPWKKLAKSLEWKDFVTKPWIGKRGLNDRNISSTQEGIDNAKCLDKYSFGEISPCSVLDSPIVMGLGEMKYEFMHDKSERGYPSIIDLRRDKIINHLSVADFHGTRAFLPFRFEDLNTNGTARLLKEVEDATGVKAQCEATLGKARRLAPKSITKHRVLPDDFIRWMNRYVDWDIEGRIGYTKRG